MLALVECMPSPAAADSAYLFERPVIKLSLEYQDENERRTGPGIEPRSETTDTFWQRLDVKSRGWWYHPDLLSFSFGLEPQWKQQDTMASSLFDRQDDDSFLGFFVDAHVLRKKTHSFKFFLRQSRDEFNSTLSPDNVTKTDVARAVWLVNSQRFPTTVTLESNDTHFRDFFATRDNSDTLRIETKYSTDNHRISLLSEYVDQLRQIGVQEFSSDRFLTNLTSDYAFSDRARLATAIFHLNSKSELTDTRSLSWSERLTVKHRRNLRSDFSARFDSRQSESFRSDTRLLSAALEHQLYENLTSRIELYRSTDDFSDGDIRIDDAGLDFRYVRSIPIGVLTITNGYEYRLEDNDIDAESSRVLGEAHTLSGTTPEFLARSNVDVNSVMVFNATRTTIFIEGIDYVLSIVGDSVAVERNIFGGIADGETVLVDYAFATQAPFEADRWATRFGVNLNLWRALHLYYNVSTINEDLISGTRPAELADDRIQRAGASLRWRWSTTSADYEVRDTVRTPLTRKRIAQSLAFRVTKSLSLGLSASYADTDFTDTGSDSRAKGLGGHLRWEMGRWGRFEVDAFSRDIDGQSQRTRSDGVIARWSVRYGEWSGFIRYENFDEADELTTQTRERGLVTVHVSRTFR